MAITYTWELTSLKKQTVGELNNVVVQTYWRKIGTDEGGTTGTFNGATPFKPQDVDPENFTTYENLTQEQVLGWIQSVVTGSYEDHVNEKIQQEIDSKKTPIEDVSANSFPWAS